MGRFRSATGRMWWGATSRKEKSWAARKRNSAVEKAPRDYGLYPVKGKSDTQGGGLTAALYPVKRTDRVLIL